MRRLLGSLTLIALIAACGDRLRSNELLVRGNAGVVVGTPVRDGLRIVGRVKRTRPLGENLAVSFAFEPDSAAPASLSELHLKTISLGAPPVFVIAPPPVVPLFGPGGRIPGKAPAP